MKKTFTLFLALAVSLLTLQSSAQMYIVGDAPFGGWNPAGGVQMTAQSDGTYTYTTTISGKVYFVFGDHLASSSSDWSTFNNNYRYGPLSDGQVVTAGTWVTTQKSREGAYCFTGNGSQYLITFDKNTTRFKVS